MKGKRFNLVGIIITLMLGVALLAAACAKPAPAPTPAPPAPAPAPQPQTFKLKYGTLMTLGTPYGDGMEWYIVEVEKRTQGRVQFERYYANSLAPAAEMIEAINNGVADVGVLAGGYHAGKTPLLTIGTLPATYANLYEALMAVHDLYEQIPAMNEELARYNARYLTSIGATQWVPFTTKPVRSLEEFKGVRVRALGAGGQLVRELGGVPVSIDAGEVYEGIQKGTLDGLIGNPGFIMSYKFQEVAKYYWDVPMSGFLSILGINRQTWDKLPPDIQQIMKDIALDHPVDYQRIYQIEGDGAGLEAMKAANVVFTPGQPEVVEQVTKIAKDKICGVNG